MTNRFQTDSDSGVLLQVASGTEHAMEQCMITYGNLVWSIANRYVKDRTSAEDVVQEIFTDLWKMAKRYDPSVSTESTFIGMLARRRAIDFIRKESRRPQLAPLLEAESVAHATDEPIADMRVDSEQVRAALRSLPQETQTLFSLHFDEGMTHPEIVEKTGLPLGTVKTRLRRGLIEVRNHLRQVQGVNPCISAAQ